MDSRPVILVMGANQGLGHETLIALAQANQYQLVTAARSQSKADEAVKAIATKTGSDPTSLTPVVIDLHDDKSIHAAAALVKEKFNHLDILVNNAGINRSPNPNATLRENYRAVFETNVFGVAVMNDVFLPLIRAFTYPRRRIVTVTSCLGMFGVALTKSSPYNAWNYQFPVYRSSKSATNMIVAVDTIALRDENIPTVLVEPG